MLVIHEFYQNYTIAIYTTCLSDKLQVWMLEKLAMGDHEKEKVKGRTKWRRGS